MQQQVSLAQGDQRRGDVCRKGNVQNDAQGHLSREARIPDHMIGRWGEMKRVRVDYVDIFVLTVQFAILV